MKFVSRHIWSIGKAVNLVAVVALLVAFSAWAQAASAHDAEVEEQIAAAERAAARGPYATDGTFTGSAEGFGGAVKMQVVIENGYIESCEIVDASHEDAEWLADASVLPERIVKANGVDIDVVSGATYTSCGILNGTAAALEKSMAGGE